MKYKSVSEQRLEHLESIQRPLTPEESDDLRRAMHAVYCRDRRHKVLAKHRKEELAILKRHREEELELLSELMNEAPGMRAA